MRGWLAVVLLVGAGCADGPTWTDATALEGHRQALDANGDGRFSRPEYEAVRWNGPPFATADVDGDGELSAVELARLVRGQSARHFDGTDPPSVKPAQGEAGALPGSGSGTQ